MIKIIKYFIEAIFIYVFFIIIKIIGLNLSRKLFSWLFNLIGPKIKSKNVINDNLYKFIGSYDEAKKKNIIFKMWSNYGKTFVEYVFLNKFKQTNSHIVLKGEHNLQKIISNKKPVIFVSGHFANFELMSMELTKKKIRLATIYRPLNNFFLNPFMEYVRRSYVCKNQIKKGISGVKDCIQYLKQNYSVALMIDQRVSEGKKLPFFDSLASTTTLPAQLALKYEVDIVPIYLARMKNETFTMEIYSPVTFSKKDKSEKNKLEISLKLNKILEEMISNDPGQWIWTHNRWK
jgi:KDO2-lipid IV(A) lauroyltransferase